MLGGMCVLVCLGVCAHSCACVYDVRAHSSARACVSTSFVPRVGAGLGKSAPEASGTLDVECCHTGSGTACA